jgi:hypothetical protein
MLKFVLLSSVLFMTAVASSAVDELKTISVHFAWLLNPGPLWSRKPPGG